MRNSFAYLLQIWAAPAPLDVTNYSGHRISSPIVVCGTLGRLSDIEPSEDVAFPPSGRGWMSLTRTAAADDNILQHASSAGKQSVGIIFSRVRCSSCYLMLMIPGSVGDHKSYAEYLPLALTHRGFKLIGQVFEINFRQVRQTLWVHDRRIVLV